MNFHRKLPLIVLAGSLICASAAFATHLAPFIDLQEQSLNMAHDGLGLWNWSGGPVNLTVTTNGPVRFALLYWTGRERPCTLDGSGTNCPFTQPYKDQLMNFNGSPITGTVIGTETQPASAGGPILNIGYYADVTSTVAAAGTGTHSFTLADGDTSSNLWRLDGAGLIVGYKDSSDFTIYRVLIWDGLDFAYGDDPTPGENRVTTPVVFNHGTNSGDRTADLLLFAGDGDANRPDNTTISNNPTQFNVLNSVQGPEFNTLFFPIDIPANVGTTTVQMNSAPAGQNPDSLLWEVAALRVPTEFSTSPDTLPPSCTGRVVSGPPTQLVVTLQDPSTGLYNIVVTQSDNADTPVPPFTPGTTDPVTITATKIDQSKGAHVTIQGTDMAGNVITCDPIITLVQRSADDPQKTRYKVGQAENRVLIMNGTPGLKNFEVTVNGITFKAYRLKDGENRTLDVSSAMHAGNKNIVTVKGHGPKDSSATVVISDGSVQ
ncbi:MAG TPA: hypothetical protein VGH73_02235 [Thermoanaerobaculia bacterium]|jgi:hypothetical protein